VLEIDGEKVNGVKDILEGIGIEVGRTIELKIQRKTSTGTDILTVRLTTAPEDDKRR
jgi:C-terminal processing protease CtpA/Prc